MVQDAARPRSGTPISQRALAPDLARGIMLLFIAIANVSWFLYGGAVHPAVVHPTDGSVVDQVFSTLAILFIDARVYPMFAFLFGYGMVQFASSRRSRGIPEPLVRRMLARRHWWLIAFGGIHAALLFAGDILGAYGLAGLLLGWLLFSRRDSALTVVVSILVAMVAGTALMGLLGAVSLSLLPAEATEGAAAGFTVGSQRVLLSGDETYLVSVLSRLTFWVMGLFGQLLGLVVPVCILLGWLAARHRYLEDPARHRRLLTHVAGWGILLGILGAIPQALSYLGFLPLPETAWWGYMGLVMFTGLCGGLGYASLFGLLVLALRNRVGAIGYAIGAVGKRSLSFYLLQSVVFAPLLSAWGFGLGARLGTAGAYAIAVTVWVFSLALAVVLERRGTRGPAEAVLRSLTYRRDDPVGLQPGSATDDDLSAR